MPSVSALHSALLRFSFCLSFIAWALSYAYIKEEKNYPLKNIKARLRQVEKFDRMHKREHNKQQMELKL